MPDLLVLTVDAQVYRNVTTPPLNTPSAAVVREVLFQQLPISVLTVDNFVVAADAVDLAIPALPAVPYDGALIIVPSIQVRVNINGQGYQVIAPGGFITMAATTSVLFKNDIVPPGQTGTPTTQPCSVRYFAVKLT